MAKGSTQGRGQVAGMDLGDKQSVVVVLSGRGEVVEEAVVGTTPVEIERFFASRARLRVAVETGTHAGWVSRLLMEFGHRVVMVNPRRAPVCKRPRRKGDRSDAELLARQLRSDPTLLYPVHVRTQETQELLALVRSRQALVRARSQLINHCRGVAKSLGQRLPACDARSFLGKAQRAVSTPLGAVLGPVIEQVGQLTQQIRRLERELDQRVERERPQVRRLREPRGVGLQTAATFVLVVEDPQRFGRARDVGAYLGLVPRREQSGEHDPALGISKSGDRLLRSLLVQAAHYMLGPFGEPCELREYGQRLLARGGRGAKKRAVVAVARKLAVLLLALWKSGQAYDPWYATRRQAECLTTG